MRLGRALGLVALLAFGGNIPLSSAWAGPASSDSNSADAAKRRLDEGLARLDGAVRLTATSSATLANFSAAQQAAEALDGLLKSGEALAAKDDGYRQYASDTSARYAIVKQSLRKNRKAFDVRVATERVTQAQSGLEAAMVQAGSEGSSDADVAAAEAAVTTLEGAVAEGSATERKDAGYKKLAEAARAAIAGSGARLAGIREARAVHTQTARVEAAKAEAAKALAAMDKAPGPKAFARSEASISDIEKVLQGGDALQAKDRRYGAYAKGVRASLGPMRAKVAAARQGLAVEGHRAQVEAAKAEVATRLQSLGPEADAGAFTAAAEAVASLDARLTAGQEIASKDRAYARVLATEKAAAGRHRAAIEKKKTAWDVAKSGAALERAQATADERVAGLGEDPKPADFDAASTALGALEAALAQATPTAAKDRAFARTVAASQGKLRAHRSALDRRRAELQVAGHRARVDAALAEVEQAMQTLQAEAGPASLSGAEGALAKLAEALKGVPEAAAQDRKHALHLRSVEKTAARHRSQVDRQRQQTQVAAHRAQVDAAKAVVDEKLEALKGVTKHEAYQAAEDAVSALKRAVEAADEAALADRAHAAYLAGITKGHMDLRATIRQRRIESTEATVVAAMSALEGTPTPAGFEEANTAIGRYAGVIDANASFGERHPGFARFVAGAKKKAAAHRAALAQRRVDVQVDAQTAKLTAAEERLQEALQALQTQADPAAFSAAEAAVGQLKTEVDGSEGSATKSRAFAARRAAATKATSVATAAIAKRRLAVQVEAHQARVEAAMEKVATKMAALDGEPPAAAFDAATEAVDAADKVVEAGGEVAGQDRGHAQRLSQTGRALAGHRATIARRRIEVRAAQADQAVAGLGPDATGEQIEAASRRLTAVDSALEAGQASAKDRSVARALAAASRKAKAHRATLAARALDAEIRPHRARVDAAEAEVKARMGALDGDPKPADFGAAEDAIGGLAQAVEAGGGLAAKSRSHASHIAGVNKRIPAYRQTVQRRRAEVVLAAYRANVQASTAALEEHLRALEAPDAGPGAFKVAEDAADDLESTVAAGEPLAAKDRATARYVAATRRTLAARRAKIAGRRAAQQVAAHRAEVEAAKAKLGERLAALGPAAKHEDYQAAEDAVSALKKVLDAGDELGATDRKHGAYLAALAKQRPAQRAQIRRTRIEVAEQAALTRLGALDGQPTPADFLAAEQAVTRLEQATEANRRHGKEHAPFAKFVGEVGRRILVHRATIDKRRTDAVLNAHIAKIEAKQEAAEARVAALAGEASAETFSAAEAAVKALREEIAEEPIEASGKRRASYLVAADRSAKGFEAAIRQRRLETRVAAHRARIQEAQQTADERMAALDGTPEWAAFDQAHEALQALRQVAEEGEDIAAQDKAHAKHVAATVRAARAAEVRAAGRRIEVCEGRVGEALAALEGEPEAKQFGAAREAISNLERAQSMAKAFAASDRGLRARSATSAKKMKGHRAAVARAELEQELRPHRAKVEAAKKVVVDRVAQLAEQTRPSDFEAAAAEVRALESAIEEGAPLGLKTKAYARYLAAEKKRVPQYRKAMQDRRSEVVLAAWSATIEEARAAVDTRVEAIGGDDADASGLSAADSAVADFEGVLAQSDKLAKKNRSVAARLAAERKKLAVYRRQVQAARSRIQIAALKARVGEAKEKVDARLAALDRDAKHEDYQAAEDAISGLKKVLDSAQDVSGADAAYNRYLASLEAQRTQMRATIRQRRVEAVESKLVERLEGLDDQATEGDYAAAYQWVAKLETVVRSNRGFAAKDRGYAKFIAATERRIGTHRQDVDRRRIGGADRRLQARLEALEGAPDDDAFSAAEDALTALDTTVAARKSSFSKKDKMLLRYAKQIPRRRLQITQRRLQVAGDRAKAEVAALSQDPGEEAFEAAVRAVDAYDKTAVAAERAAKGSKDPIAKAARSAKKSARSYRATVERQRIEMEAAPHRAKVEAAEAKAAERVEALAEDAPDPEAFEAASQAVRTLVTVVDEGSRHAARSKGYARSLAAVRKKGRQYEARIARRRAELRAQGHRARVEEAQSGAEQAVGGLGDAPDADALQAADKALVALGEVIAEGRPLAKRDKRHGKLLAQAARRASGLRAELDERRILAAKAALDAQVAALRDEPDAAAFTQAHEAVGALKEALRAGRRSGKRSPKLRRRMSKLAKQLPAQRVAIERERIQAASAAVEGRVEGLGDPPDPAAVDAAQEAHFNLMKVLAASRSNRKLAKVVKAERKKAKRYKAQIARKRVAMELRPHQEQLEEAAAQAAAAVGQLDGDEASEAALRSADAAVANLQKAVEEGRSVAKKSRAYAKKRAAQRKKIGGYLATIDRARVRGDVDAHRAEVDASQTSVEQAIAALDAESEHEDYQAAMEGVSTLRKVVERGEPLAERDRRYAKYLASVEKKRSAYPARIRRRRIEAALDVAQQRVGALDGDASETQVAEARRAIARVKTAVASNSADAKRDKGYAKFVAQAKRRHWRLRMDLARAVSKARIAALDEDASEDELRAAEASVAEQSKVLADGRRIIKKSRTLKKVGAAAKKEVRGNRALIQRKRIQTLTAQARQGVEALAEDPSTSAIYDAEERVANLDEGLKKAKPLIKKSRSLARTVKAAKRDAKAFKRAIKRAKRGGDPAPKRKKRKRRRRSARRG